LFTFNASGKIKGINEWDGGEPPRFYLARSAVERFCRIRDDVPDLVAEALRKLVAAEAFLNLQTLPKKSQSLPRFHREYVRLLSQPSDAEPSEGPVFVLSKPVIMPSPGVLAITADNAVLLERFLPDWIPDVSHWFPFWASIEDGHAVAVCASVRMTDKSHEAGVESAVAYC